MGDSGLSFLGWIVSGGGLDRTCQSTSIHNLTMTLSIIHCYSTLPVRRLSHIPHKPPSPRCHTMYVFHSRTWKFTLFFYAILFFF